MSSTGKPDEEKSRDMSHSTSRGQPQREPRGLYGQRPSRSHDELLRREFARLAAMTARERMPEALSLQEVEPLLRRRPEKTGKGGGGE
jgi:hypothetical protein